MWLQASSKPEDVGATVGAFPRFSVGGGDIQANLARRARKALPHKFVGCRNGRGRQGYSLQCGAGIGIRQKISSITGIRQALETSTRWTTLKSAMGDHCDAIAVNPIYP